MPETAIDPKVMEIIREHIMLALAAIKEAQYATDLSDLAEKMDRDIRAALRVKELPIPDKFLKGLMREIDARAATRSVGRDRNIERDFGETYARLIAQAGELPPPPERLEQVKKDFDPIITRWWLTKDIPERDVIRMMLSMMRDHSDEVLHYMDQVICAKDPEFAKKGEIERIGIINRRLVGMFMFAAGQERSDSVITGIEDLIKLGVTGIRSRVDRILELMDQVDEDTTLEVTEDEEYVMNKIARQFVEINAMFLPDLGSANSISNLAYANSQNPLADAYHNLVNALEAFWLSFITPQGTKLSQEQVLDILERLNKAQTALNKVEAVKLPKSVAPISEADMEQVCRVLNAITKINRIVRPSEEDLEKMMSPEVPAETRDMIEDRLQNMMQVRRGPNDKPNRFPDIQWIPIEDMSDPAMDWLIEPHLGWGFGAPTSQVTEDQPYFIKKIVDEMNEDMIHDPRTIAFKRVADVYIGDGRLHSYYDLIDRPELVEEIWQKVNESMASTKTWVPEPLPPRQPGEEPDRTGRKPIPEPTEKDKKAEQEWVMKTRIKVLEELQTKKQHILEEDKIRKLTGEPLKQWEIDVRKSLDQQIEQAVRAVKELQPEWEIA